MYTKTIAATPPNTPSAGIVITLENTGIFVSILVSSCILVATAYGVVSRINRVSSSIEKLEKQLEEQARLARKLEKIDRELELHIQEYINRKDVIQMVLGQMNEKIDHKFRRAIFYSRDIQKYLQAKTDFKIREYEETTQSPED